VAPEQCLPLFAAKDLQALIGTTFEVLGAAVQCEFASAFYLNAGDRLLKQRDSRGREYGPEHMRRYAELTPALPLALANPGITLLTTRESLPSHSQALRRTAFYLEIMQVEGWRHAVALCFWGQPGNVSPVFVASVNRVDGQRDFAAREIDTLRRLHPFIDSAINRVYESDAAKTIRDGMAMAVNDGTGGFAILDWNLDVVQANSAARQLRALWTDHRGREGRKTGSVEWHLPSTLVAQCRDLQREWRSRLRVTPDATGLGLVRHLEHPRIHGLTASITLVCPSTPGLADPTFLVEFSQRLNGVVFDAPDRSAPILQKMTSTERAVALVLANGLSNQEIAERLGKTVNAVKFLLHRIYRKTGVPSRAALVAVLRGGRPLNPSKR